MALIPNPPYFNEVTDSAMGMLSLDVKNNPINTRQGRQKADLYSTVFVYLIWPGVTMVTEAHTLLNGTEVLSTSTAFFLIKISGVLHLFNSRGTPRVKAPLVQTRPKTQPCCKRIQPTCKPFSKLHSIFRLLFNN